MIDAPIAFAFAAGLVATVNPCGFAMLPAYLAYFLGAENPDEAAAPGGSLPRALLVGATVSAGLLVVFAAAGSLLSAGIRSFIDYVPWVALLIGLGLVALGIAMLAGFHLRVALPRFDRGGSNRRLSSLFLFGISYAVASLSCTLPVFLTVVSGTVTRSNFASGVVAFVVYGLGMSLVLVALTLAVALTKTTVVRHLKQATRHVDRISGALLVVAGAYLAYYWAFNLTHDPAKSGAGPARWAEQLSRRLTEWIDSIGPTRLGIILGGSIAAVAAYTVTLRWLTPADKDTLPPVEETVDETPAATEATEEPART
jgi:cytochrome c-type biogenesis protein